MRLRITCKQWKRAIDSTPTFWVLLSNWEPISAWDKILENNPFGPICMSYTAPYPFKELRRRFTFPTPNDFLEIAAKEVNRLQSCRFMVVAERGVGNGMEAQLVNTLISLKAPLLTEIVIDRSVNDTEPESFNLFGGYAPRLKLVSFTHAPSLLWTSFTLRGLLAIDVDGGSGVSVEKLLTRVLPFSPNLVHLCIRDEMVSVLPSATAGLPHLLLPALKTMYIAHITGPSIAYILGTVEVPAIDWLVVEHIKGSTIPDPVYENLGQIIGSSAASVSSPLRVRLWQHSITVGPKYFHLKRSSLLEHSNTMACVINYIPKGLLDCTVYLSVESDVIESSIPDVLAALHAAFSGTTQLFISGGCSLEWTKVLITGGTLPSLTHIVVHGGYPSTDLFESLVELGSKRRQSLRCLHVGKDSPRYILGFEAISKECDGIISIKTDAPRFWLKDPLRRDYFDLSYAAAPLYPAVREEGWVEMGPEDEFGIDLDL